MSGISRDEVSLLRKLIREDRLQKSEAQEILLDLHTARERDEDFDLHAALRTRGLQVDPEIHASPHEPVNGGTIDRDPVTELDASVVDVTPAAGLQPVGVHVAPAGGHATGTQGPGTQGTGAQATGIHGYTRTSESHARFTRPRSINPDVRPPRRAPRKRRQISVPRLTLLVLLLAGLAGSSWYLWQPHTEPSSQPVRACFEDYRAALLAGDGERAAMLVDRETLKHYDDLRFLALMGSPEEVSGRPPVDQLMILATRQLLDREHVTALTGRGLLAFLATQPWQSLAPLEALKLGEIQIDGSLAIGLVHAAGSTDELRWTFHAEGDSWRVQAALENLSAFWVSCYRPGQSPVKELARLIQKPVSKEIWKPLLMVRTPGQPVEKEGSR